MQTRTRIFVGILFVAILLLAFFQTPLMREARNTAWGKWVVLVGNTLGFRDAVLDQKLSDELASFLSENTSLKAELADYQRLKKELGTPSVQQLRPISAAIISRTIDTFSSEFIISKGITSGVAIGDPVVVFGTTLVGFVTETQNEGARVRTLYHPNTHVTAEVRSEDTEAPPARGLITSKLYAGLYITTIPRDITISDGQSVATVTDETRVPTGLVVGSISSVESKEHDAYQSARIATPYDIDTISAVTVLTQP